MLLLAMMIILPLRLVNATLLGCFAFIVHEIFILKTSDNAPPPLLMGYSICVFSLWVILSVAAYLRERGMREVYLDQSERPRKMKS